MSLTPPSVMLATEPTTGCAEGFVRALLVWVNKPHVINRRLCGSKLVSLRPLPFTETDGDIVKSEYTRDRRPDCEIETGCQEVEVDSVGEEKFVVVRELLPKNSERHPTNREIIIFNKPDRTVTFYPASVGLASVTLGNDTSESTSPEPTLLDRSKLNSFSFKFVHSESGNSIELHAKSSCESDTGSIGLSMEWIRKQLLPKLARWAGEKELKTSLTSLRLVPVDGYSKLYEQLKQKYGPWLVENWTEKTDPQKFVYEDIAIATYLLLLWHCERQKCGVEKKQTFVDLGCGNGLLVYILSAEGHQGVGLDVRRRKIWSLFDSMADLKECSITPSADSLFPDYDWLIGNHSDELTPWIPVMAARSGYSCSFFVLPCCHFDFHQKFSQKSRGSSQYHTYLEFVREVGEICGFSVEQDTLRIPSTKRVCFLGRKRTYPECDEKRQDIKRSEYIADRCRILPDSARTDKCGVRSDNSLDISASEDLRSNDFSLEHDNTRTEADCDISNPHPDKLPWKLDRTITDVECESSIYSKNLSNKRLKLGTVNKLGTTEPWVKQFEPRSKVETTRNCQKVERSVRDHMVQTVFDCLLQCEDSVVRTLPDGTAWRKGGSLPLSEVVALFDRDLLLKLKAECGGIQTLLRNSSSIFKVTGGVVRIRDPFDESKSTVKRKQQKTDARDYYKTAPCWFHLKHPDGCPQPSQACSFAHGWEELKPRPANRNTNPETEREQLQIASADVKDKLKQTPH